jgi:hypothetical protein
VKDTWKKILYPLQGTFTQLNNNFGFEILKIKYICNKFVSSSDVIKFIKYECCEKNKKALKILFSKLVFRGRQIQENFSKVVKERQNMKAKAQIANPTPN